MNQTDTHKPSWAFGEGTKKKCVKCQVEFLDYTSKQKHTVCRPCYLINQQKHGYVSCKVKPIYRKSEKELETVCTECDGVGCLACDNGIAEIEPEQELSF